MVTVQNAMIYSANGEMCYELQYSEGTIIRAVESAGKFIRNEYKVGDAWVASGKPYIVSNDKRRNAEVIRDKVKAFLN